MNDDRIAQLEARIRELEEKVQDVLTSEHGLINAHQALKDEFEDNRANYRETVANLREWSDDLEGRIQEINDHLYPAFFKLFPEQEGLWPEIEASLARKKDVSLSNLPVPPEEPCTHDKFCLCPACTAKEAKRIAEKAAQHTAATGHPLSCMCDVCNERRPGKNWRDDPDLPPEPPPGPRANPYVSSLQGKPGMIWRAEKHVTPKPHEPDCICDKCVRARGTGKKPS